FDRELAPTHAFSAFYRWIREDFGADVVLHFGTHGALEFMPGKQVGLGEGCWPDRLLGALPNVYLYASNNPSEGVLAKRRAAATLVSYLTPPISHAGLYRGLLDLKSSLDRWRSLPPDADAESRGTLVEVLQAQAAAVDLAEASPAWNGDAPQRIDALRDQVLELEYTLIPNGLHVVGQAPALEERIGLLAAMFANELQAAADPQAEVRAMLAGTPTVWPAPLVAEVCEADAHLCGSAELDGLIRALDGRFVPPVCGGDLLRTRTVLPAGRNLHGFDPGRLPSAAALAEAHRQVDRLLARHDRDGHGGPETIGLVLWGTDNLKTEGQPIAQALALLGARPRLDALGRVIDAELVPLEELGRPRLDVVLTVSGVFRDLLPFQLRLLASACQQAALADEPEALNFVRAHTR
ncbi:MAG: cobaltochelatase subunit CobN, partial [Gemmatimonadetes bacterium]|nr:cobaltochelatase subunit CobN [Gemmatimonadota bacterium]